MSRWYESRETSDRSALRAVNRRRKLTRLGAEPASKADQAQKKLLDGNRERVAFSRGQHWTPVAGQSSTAVYTFSLFLQWFHPEVHTILIDLVGSELYDDEI